MSQPEDSAGERPDPIEAELRAAGERVRANLLRRGVELVDANREEKARESMHAIMDAPPPSETALARPRVRLVPLVLAAAAAVLALSFWLWRSEGSGPVTLGPKHLRIVAPSGAVVSFSSFRWEGELRAGEQYELVIQDAERHPIERQVLSANGWSPAREDSLPEKIRWRVRILDPFMTPLATDEAEAWRSR